jgi:hypothetical protein
MIVETKMGFEGGDYDTSPTLEAISTLDRTVPGTLQLKKIIVNDNGAAATADDFTIAFSFDDPVWGCNAVNETTTCESQIWPLPAGEYRFSEIDLPGYTEGSWSCTRNAGAGGDSSESDWTLVANGGTAGTLSGAGAADNADVQSGAGFQAGTYALSEAGFYDGYQNGTPFSCELNGGAAFDTNSITLDVGDVAYCSITNVDIPQSYETAWAANGLGDTFIGSLPYHGPN